MRSVFRFALILMVAGCGSPPAAQQPPIVVHPPTRIVFGGDVMLSRHVGRLIRQHADPAWPFRKIASCLAEADIAFVNLESPFSDRGQIVTQGMIFKAEPDTIEGLRIAGVDVVSTANNHARDCGSHGVAFTLEWLSRNGIAAIGTAGNGESLRRGVVLDRNGVRFGFLAYTYDQSNGNHPQPDDRIAMLDVARMSEDVRALLLRADVAIVSMHAGIEYAPKPSPAQVSFARAAIDAGAAVVAGHHPHVVQPVERYRGGVIFYSLGNLVFDQFHRKDTQESVLAEVVFDGATMRGYKLLPVDIVQTVPRLRGATGELPD